MLAYKANKLWINACCCLKKLGWVYFKFMENVSVSTLRQQTSTGFWLWELSRYHSSIRPVHASKQQKDSSFHCIVNSTSSPVHTCFCTLEPYVSFRLKISKIGQMEGRVLDLICTRFTFILAAGAFTRCDLQSECGGNVYAGITKAFFKENI